MRRRRIAVNARTSDWSELTDERIAASVSRFDTIDTSARAVAATSVRLTPKTSRSRVDRRRVIGLCWMVVTWATNARPLDREVTVESNRMVS